MTALNNFLVTDISRQTRLHLRINSNDAQDCYDPIVLWISSLALQRVGSSTEAAFSMTKTLQSATHDIATAFGISIDNHFTTTPPHQGSEQGDRAGPTIWVMIRYFTNHYARRRLWFERFVLLVPISSSYHRVRIS